MKISHYHTTEYENNHIEMIWNRIGFVTFIVKFSTTDIPLKIKKILISFN